MTPDGRKSSAGDAMERAEVQATESMAQVCRTPGDYALFGYAGRHAVENARKMTQAQRSEYVVRMELAIHDLAVQVISTNRN